VRLIRRLLLVVVLLGLAFVPNVAELNAFDSQCGCELIGPGWTCGGTCDCPCSPAPCTCGCSSCIPPPSQVTPAWRTIP